MLFTKLTSKSRHVAVIKLRGIILKLKDHRLGMKDISMGMTMDNSIRKDVMLASGGWVGTR